MSRFILLTPVYGNPPSAPSGRKLGTGTTIADSTGNALPGDVVFPSLCIAPSKLNMAPLDAAGQALMPGSVIITPAQLAGGLGMLNPAAATYQGPGSGGGAGLDAGD